ncbi:hypothetical protein ACWEAF_26280 [Streptomyces sp. NPDC005071]
MVSISSPTPNGTSPVNPMTPEQYSHIRAHLSQAALKFGGIDYVSPTFGLVRDAMAEVDRLRARVDEVERAYTYDTAALKKRADELDKTLDEVMAERDGMHDALDQFALTVAPEDVIGEHSSGNNPWANALELLTPMAEVDRLRAEQAARIVELETALAAAGRSLSSFIFDSDDPSTDALGAQWLYWQAMPLADDPFVQPRAFRSSVFSEAAKAVEEMDGRTPDDHQERPQSYLDGYSDGLQDAAESLEKLADQAAEGSEATS